MLLRAAHPSLVFALRREAAERGGAAVAARELRLRPIEPGSDVGRVAREDVRDALGVVEADERVGDDERALREPGALLGERHGRLQLRDEVVAEVADDGDVETVHLVEGEHVRAGADEGVTAEAASLDRFQQEARASRAAQAQVRPKRGDQVGCDLGRGDHSCGRSDGKTSQRRSRDERSGCAASVRPGFRPARGARPTCESRKSCRLRVGARPWEVKPRSAYR